MTVMVVFSTELFRAESGKRVITSKIVCPFPKECFVLLELPISVSKAISTTVPGVKGTEFLRVHTAHDLWCCEWQYT